MFDVFGLLSVPVFVTCFGAAHDQEVVRCQSLFASSVAGVNIMSGAFATLIVFFIALRCSSAQVPDAGYSREELQPLTEFRQQHRKTVDGRLCAAASVQNRQTYTGASEIVGHPREQCHILQ